MTGSAEMVTVQTEDGWPLQVQRLRHDAPKGVVVLGHAMFCNAKTMDRRGTGLAWALHHAGFDVWNADLRGHGGSGPSASEGGVWSYDDIVLRDLPALVSSARLEVPTGPLVLVGHSLGAHAAVACMGVRRGLPVDRVVSLAGNVWISQLEPHPARWLVKRAVFEAWWGITAAVGYCPIVQTGFGTDDEAAPYVRQFVQNGRRNVWQSQDGQIDYLDRMGAITTPILSVVGQADEWMCHPICAREWLSHARRSPVRHRVVGPRTGDPSGIDHMGLVLRPEMASVWEEVAFWALTGG